MTKLLIKLTSYSGRGELYVSQTNTNPRFGGFNDASASSMESFVMLSYDITKVPDLWNWSLYIGVYGVETTNFAL